MLAAGHAQAALRGGGRLRERRGRLVRIRDAEPPAHVEELDGDPVLLAQPHGQRHQHIELAKERSGGEDLGGRCARGDLGTEDGERGRRRDRLRHNGRGNAERRRLVTSRDRLMGVHTQPGSRGAGTAARCPPRPRTRPASGVRPPVRDDSPRGLERRAPIRRRIVPPVEGDARGCHTGPHAGFDLAAGRGQEVEPLIDCHPKHRMRAERLDGVERLGNASGPPGTARSDRRDRTHQRRGEAIGQRQGARSGDPHAVRLEGRVRRPGVRSDRRVPVCGSSVPSGAVRSAIDPIHDLGRGDPQQTQEVAITCFVPVASPGVPGSAPRRRRTHGIPCRTGGTSPPDPASVCQPVDPLLRGRRQLARDLGERAQQTSSLSCVRTDRSTSAIASARCPGTPPCAGCSRSGHARTERSRPGSPWSAASRPSMSKFTAESLRELQQREPCSVRPNLVDQSNQRDELPARLDMVTGTPSLRNDTNW